jgi:hypothetical protein
MRLRLLGGFGRLFRFRRLRPLEMPLDLRALLGHGNEAKASP